MKDGSNVILNGTVPNYFESSNIKHFGENRLSTEAHIFCAYIDKTEVFLTNIEDIRNFFTQLYNGELNGVYNDNP